MMHLGSATLTFKLEGKEYAESPQRKAALERMNKPTEKPAP